MGLFEQSYDAMSEADREGMDVLYKDWIESFEKAKTSGDIADVYDLMQNTDSRYCLWKILQYLKKTAMLESSQDPYLHWKGYLAKINIPICASKLEKSWKV